ncbi:YdeI family protein [Bacteroidota bacterium]
MSTISVDAYILSKENWQPALNMLREIMHALNMEETVKWGGPVYCLDGKNVIGVGAFKHHVAILFYQGVFLKDKAGILYTADEGETRSLRQWRFSSADEIEANLDLILEYVKEAIENSRQGKVLKPSRNRKYTVPEELKDAFHNDPDLKKAFELLSNSKRRDYCIYIGQAKMSETRHRRLQKVILLIRDGKGLMDQYQ